MKKNPILVLTGLAVAAAAGIAGLTRDQWMSPAPQVQSGTETTPAPAAAPAVQEQPAAKAEQPAAEAEAPAAAAVAEPAPATNPPATTVAEAPAAPAAETPAPASSSEPAAEAPAPAEATAAPVVAEAAPATSDPAPETEVAETPAPVAQPEQPAASAQPAAEASPPATEPPAAAPAEQQAVVTPPPAPAEQQAAVTPPPEAPAAPVAAPETPKVVEAPPPAAAPDTIPTFDTVRLEKTGEAIIAGTAAAGAEVVVMLDGEAIGKTVANTDGAFVVVPDKPLPTGSGALTIEAKAEGASAPTASEQTVAVIVPDQPKKEAMVAVVSPTEPTKVLQKAEPEAAPAPEATAPPAEGAPKPAGPTKLVSIDAVDYDTAGNIVFTGRGQPGHSARIYVDNSHSGDAAIGEDGHWAFSGTTSIKTGVHALRVDGIDGSGKVLNRVEVPFFREETNKVAAAAPDQADGKTDQQQPEAASPAIKNVDGRVVIQPGNNLWRISKVLYGSGAKYTLLYEANKDLIRDPDMIYPGQVFKTPDAVAPQDTVDPDLREPLDKVDDAGSAQ